MRALRIHHAAAEEAAEAAAWYEGQRPGLGAEFIRALDAALDSLESEAIPLTAMPATRGVKRLILRRFPFSIVIHERENALLVLAFAHHSRRPGYWRGRKKS